MDEVEREETSELPNTDVYRSACDFEFDHKWVSLVHKVDTGESQGGQFCRCKLLLVAKSILVLAHSLLLLGQVGQHFRDAKETGHIVKLMSELDKDRGSKGF